jgi:hypothetical protein
MTQYTRRISLLLGASAAVEIVGIVAVVYSCLSAAYTVFFELDHFLTKAHHFIEMGMSFVLMSSADSLRLFLQDLSSADSSEKILPFENEGYLESLKVCVTIVVGCALLIGFDLVKDFTGLSTVLMPAASFVSVTSFGFIYFSFQGKTFKEK